MLKAVTVTNFKNESLRMELSSPENSGLLVYNVTGIGSPTAAINSTDLATVDGARFNSARAQTRNIVLTLAYVDQTNLPDENGHYTYSTKNIEQSRHKSYKYFSTKKPITLRFETEERTVVIDGYVENNDAIVFSSSTYSTISIICMEPYFRLPEPREITFKTIDPYNGFEFPFENDSLTEDLITFGEIKNDSVYTIYYDGDSDVGMVITMQAYEPATGINIYNTETREHMSIDDRRIFQITGGYISTGDIITISTVKGHKYATLQRDVTVYNILNAIGKNSDWIQLTQGRNVIGYTATAGIDFLAFKLSYDVLYEGV